MQPESLHATTKPKGPLEWGQLNFLHTTDTHGWLAGHLKERNYGADWGDYVSFVKHMRKKADKLRVDLLLIDTGEIVFCAFKTTFAYRQQETCTMAMDSAT